MCDLATKMAWKLGDPATRGPPPFKALKHPEGLWEKRAEGMVATVAATCVVI